MMPHCVRSNLSQQGARVRTMPSIAPTAAPAVPTAEPTQVMPGRQPVCCHVIWHRSRADLSSHYISSSADRIMPTIRVLCAVVIFALYQGSTSIPQEFMGSSLRKSQLYCCLAAPLAILSALGRRRVGLLLEGPHVWVQTPGLPPTKHSRPPNTTCPPTSQYLDGSSCTSCVSSKRCILLRGAHGRLSTPASNRHPTTTQLDNIPPARVDAHSHND